MTQTVSDLENTFARAWELLTRNWIIALPPFVLGLIGGALTFLLSVVLLGSLVFVGKSTPAGSAAVASVSALAGTIATMLVVLLIAIVQMAYVTGMAGSAWRHGTTTLRDGWSAFTHRGVQIGITIVLLFVIGLCAAVLAPVTFLVSLLAYMIFCIYAMAAVIIGERDAVGAIVESARLSLANIGPTIAVVALIVVLAVVGGIAGHLVGRIQPVVGGIVSVVIQQLTVAYAALVITGEYLKLREQASA